MRAVSSPLRSPVCSHTYRQVNLYCWRPSALVNVSHVHLPLCRFPGVSQQSAWLGRGSLVQCRHFPNSSMHGPPQSCITQTHFSACVEARLHYFIFHCSVCVPVIEVLGYDEVFQVVVYGSLIILEKGVGVAQAVAGLGLHSSILQLPRQLQRPPDRQTGLFRNTAEASMSACGLLYATSMTLSKKHSLGTRQFQTACRRSQN